jgi:ankyrin repeat protein
MMPTCQRSDSAQTQDTDTEDQVTGGSTDNNSEPGNDVDAIDHNNNVSAAAAEETVAAAARMTISASTSSATTTESVTPRSDNNDISNYSNSSDCTIPQVSIHRHTLSVFELDTALQADPNRINELKALPNGITYTPLQAAADCGNIEVARYLLTSMFTRNNTNHNIRSSKARNNASSISYAQADSDDSVIVDSLDLNRRTENGDTALMLANNRGHHDIVTLLAEYGAQLDCQNREGFSALMLAASRSDHNTVSLLARHGASLDLQNQVNISYYLTSHLCFDRVVIVLQYGSYAVILAWQRGENATPLTLVEFGASIDSADTSVRNPLFYAKQHGFGDELLVSNCSIVVSCELSWFIWYLSVVGDEHIVP